MKESILVITSFPPRGEIHAEPVVGIASYAKNTLMAIREHAKNKSDLKITVLAEKLPGEKSYTENGINVKRVWKRNSLSTFPNILKYILKYTNSSNTVVIEFELSMFGNLLYLLPFPIFLVALWIINKKIIFVLHQVIVDFAEIAPHINVSSNSFMASFLSSLLGIFYRFIMFIANKVIVFEEGLKEKLSRLGSISSRKIVVIPHGVEEFENTPTKDRARKKLGISKNAYVILSFGYIAWYKGSDWLVSKVKELKKKARKNNDSRILLVLAGGANPNHEDKEYYTRYVQSVLRKCERNGFLLTGFVKEQDIPLYFKACDLVVFPYRTFMSSSGPLSMTFSFNKPFLLSPKLKRVLSNDDIKNLLGALRLRQKDLVFDDFDDDFGKKIKKLRSNVILVQKMSKLSRETKKARSWKIIGKKYYEELTN